MDNKNKILTIVENLANLFYSKELKEKLADTVYYYNGNDGTSFDRRMNNMTCEIGLGWKEELNNDYYAIKVNFEPNGARFYVYDFTDPQKIIKKGFVTLKQYDFKSISYYLEKEYDKRGLYDKHARIGYIEIFKEETIDLPETKVRQYKNAQRKYNGDSSYSKDLEGQIDSLKCLLDRLKSY